MPLCKKIRHAPIRIATRRDPTRRHVRSPARAAPPERAASPDPSAFETRPRRYPPNDIPSRFRQRRTTCSRLESLATSVSVEIRQKVYGVSYFVSYEHGPREYLRNFEFSTNNFLRILRESFRVFNSANDSGPWRVKLGATWKKAGGIF